MRGFPAVEVLRDNTLTMARAPFVSGGGKGPKIGGAGIVRAPLGEGKVSATTDANGDVVVAHGSGRVPEALFVQGISSSLIHCTVVSSTAENFTVRAFAGSGAPLANSRIAFYWTAQR